MFPFKTKDQHPQLQKKYSTYTKIIDAITGCKSKFIDLGSRESVNLFLATPPARKAVTLISDLGSSRPAIVRDKQTKKVQEKHDVLSLLQNPSFGVSLKEFIWQACVNYEVTANNYFLLTKGLTDNKNVFQLYNVSPVEVTMEISNGKIQSYTRTIEYDSGTQTMKAQIKYMRKVIVSGGYRVTFEDGEGNELWHMKEYNPLCSSYGKSKISTLNDSINGFNAAGKHNRNLIENGCSPSGYLFSKTNVPDEEYVKLESNFTKDYTGVKNAGKPILLEGDISYQEAHISPREMDWINGRAFDERLIYDLYGVPQALVDNKSSSFNNLSTSMYMLYEHTEFPLLDKIYGELTDFLMYYYSDEKLEIYYSKENIPSLDAIKTESTLNKSRTGIYTVDELRVENGLEELPNGEGKVLVNSKPQTEESTDDAKGIYLDLMRKENYNLQIKELENEGLL